MLRQNFSHLKTDRPIFEKQTKTTTVIHYKYCLYQLLEGTSLIYYWNTWQTKNVT